MTPLGRLLYECNEWIELEIQNARPLEGVYLKAFQNYVKADWQFKSIYFTRSSLIVTDIADYEEIKTSCPNLTDILVLELRALNISLYVISIVADKKLNTLLGGAS